MSRPLQPASMRALTRRSLFQDDLAGAATGLGIALHQRCLPFGVAHPHIVCGLLDLAIQHIVAAEAEDVSDAVGLTPRHGLMAPVMTVAAKGELRLRPVRADATRDAA